MYDPTFMSRLTAAVHEDRMRALRRSRRAGRCAPSSPVHRTLGLSRRLVRRLQASPPRVARRNQLPS